MRDQASSGSERLAGWRLAPAQKMRPGRCSCVPDQEHAPGGLSRRTCRRAVIVEDNPPAQDQAVLTQGGGDFVDQARRSHLPVPGSRNADPPDFLVYDVGHFSPAEFGLLSSEGVGHRLLLFRNEVLQPFLDARIEMRRLIALQPTAGELVGTLRRSLLPLGQPLLVGVVVGD